MTRHIFVFFSTCGFVSTVFPLLFISVLLPDEGVLLPWNVLYWQLYLVFVYLIGTFLIVSPGSYFLHWSSFASIQNRIYHYTGQRWLILFIVFSLPLCTVWDCIRYPGCSLLLSTLHSSGLYPLHWLFAIFESRIVSAYTGPLSRDAQVC